MPKPVGWLDHPFNIAMMLRLPIGTWIDHVVGLDSGFNLSCHGVQFSVNSVSLTSGVRTNLCSWWCNLLGAVTLAHRYLLARLPTGSPY